MKKDLSPICRRAFFQKLGGASLAVLPVAGAIGVGLTSAVSNKESAGCYGDGGYGDGYGDGSCGYCNGPGRNYYHCDGMYCNYINYSDGW